MSGLVMLAHLLRERLSWKDQQPRTPEHDLVMDNAAQNAAFAEAGREDGILAFRTDSRRDCASSVPVFSLR